MITSYELAERIKRRARENGIKLSDLLLRCDLNINTINQLKFKEGLSCFSLLKIAEELNCSIDYLMGRTDNPKVNYTKF